MKRLPVIVVLLFYCSSCNHYKYTITGKYNVVSVNETCCQTESMIYGKVRDKETNNFVMGCEVSVKSIKKGTFTDSNGYFEIALPAGRYNVSVQHVGHKFLKTQKLIIPSSTKTKIIFYLGKNVIY